MIEPGGARDQQGLRLGDRVESSETAAERRLVEFKPGSPGGSETFRADRGPRGRWFVWQRLGAGWSALRGCRDQREAHRLAHEMNLSSMAQRLGGDDAQSA